MKEQLQDKLVEILTQIQSAVGKASDFAMDQIPDIAYQYIKFKTVWYTVEGIAFIALVVGCIYTFKYSQRKYKDTEWNNEGYGFMVVASCLVCALAVMGVLHNIYSLLLVTMAPKIWLIQALAELAKGSCK